MKATLTVTIQTWLNDGPGRFTAYEPGDRLYEGPTITVEVPDSPEWYGALDAAWAIGNRMGQGVNGQEWPAYVRSLCAGDVLTIRIFPGGPVLTWSIERIGFRAIGQMKDAVSVGPLALESERQAWALAVSVSEFGRVSDRGAFGPPARSLEEAGLA